MKNGVSHLYTTIWSPPPHFGGLVTHCFFVNWRLMTHWTKREEKTFSFFAYCLKTYNFRVTSPVLLVFNSKLIKLAKIKTKMENRKHSNLFGKFPVNFLKTLNFSRNF